MAGGPGEPAKPGRASVPPRSVGPVARSVSHLPARAPEDAAHDERGGCPSGGTMKTSTRMTAWAAFALVLLAGIDASYSLPTLHDSARLLPTMDDVVIGAVGMCTPCDTLD